MASLGAGVDRQRCAVVARRGSIPSPWSPRCRRYRRSGALRTRIAVVVWAGMRDSSWFLDFSDHPVREGFGRARSTQRSQGLSQSSEGLYTRRVRGSVAHVVAEPEPPVRRCRRERRSSSRGGSELRSKSTSAPTSGIARSASAGPCGCCPVELAPPMVVRGCVGVPRPVRRSRGSVTD